MMGNGKMIGEKKMDPTDDGRGGEDPIEDDWGWEKETRER